MYSGWNSRGGPLQLTPAPNYCFWMYGQTSGALHSAFFMLGYYGPWRIHSCGEKIPVMTLLMGLGFGRTWPQSRRQDILYSWKHELNWLVVKFFVNVLCDARMKSYVASVCCYFLNSIQIFYVNFSVLLQYECHQRFKKMLKLTNY